MKVKTHDNNTSLQYNQNTERKVWLPINKLHIICCFVKHSLFIHSNEKN